jgi:hypothetical protein
MAIAKMKLVSASKAGLAMPVKNELAKKIA